MNKMIWNLINLLAIFYGGNLHAENAGNIFDLGCSFDDREKLTNRMFNASILIEKFPWIH